MVETSTKYSSKTQHSLLQNFSATGIQLPWHTEEESCGDPALTPFPSRINPEFQFYIKCNESVSLQLYLRQVLCLLFLDALKSICCD